MTSSRHQARFRNTDGIIPGAKHRSVASNSHARHGNVVLWDKLVGALILSQIPDTHITSAVAADEFALVWVDDDVIYRYAMAVISLDASGAGVPNFDGAILRARDHPFALTVKCHAGDITGMSIEGENSIRIA